jgi:hypothetical protein
MLCITWEFFSSYRGIECSLCEPFEAQWLPYAQPQIVNLAYSLYLCVFCVSMNKQRLFAYVMETGWIL